MEYLSKQYHINHIRISPYNSRANGLVERRHFDVRESLVKAAEGIKHRWTIVALLSLSREDSRITQGGCSGRTRWSSSLDCSTTYTSSIMAMLLLIHDHMSF